MQEMNLNIGRDGERMKSKWEREAGQLEMREEEKRYCLLGCCGEMCRRDVISILQKVSRSPNITFFLAFDRQSHNLFIKLKNRFLERAGERYIRGTRLRF